VWELTRPCVAGCYIGFVSYKDEKEIDVFKFIRRYAYAFFMGGAFTWLSDYYFGDWQWWFFNVILIILIHLRDLDND
jgi:hypothetical protein